MEIGEEIRRARLRKRISQKELADKTGRSQAAINKIEAGETKRSRYLSEIMEFLGLNPRFYKKQELDLPSPDFILPEAIKTVVSSISYRMLLANGIEASDAELLAYELSEKVNVVVKNPPSPILGLNSEQMLTFEIDRLTNEILGKVKKNTSGGSPAASGG
jgi:transcriptional regulator with XRE-family HTH domain